MNWKPACLAPLLLLGAASPVESVPEGFFGNGFFPPVIPATPKFGANLTREFLTAAHWEEKDLPGPWEAIEGGHTRRMTANPILFGAIPDSVVARHDEAGLRRIDITYLDAGSFFRFQEGGERSHQQRRSGQDRRSEFDSLYRRQLTNLRDRLADGCGPATPITRGETDLLEARSEDFMWDDFRLRLIARDGHSVALQISRRDDEREIRRSYLREEVAALTPEARTDLLRGNLRQDHGSQFLENIPVAHQGHTPYCGIHSLAMVTQYLGLELTGDDLAAAAEFRNTGSARGSRMLDLYRAAAEEGGLKLKHSSRFDARRLVRSLESGVPVIVWRRVTKEREQAHRELSQRLARNPNASVPASDPQMWPRRESKRLPSHGSVLIGYHAEREEVIYAEPWGDATRRRMSAAELEASVYAAFYFQVDRR